MNVLIAATAALLCSIGTYLVLQRKLSRVIIGIGLLSHGANLLLLTSGNRGLAPLIGSGDPEDLADPLPQALVLTAIVISFGVMALLLALAYRSWLLTHDDEIPDDVEDRALARRQTDEDTELVDAASLPTNDPEQESATDGHGVLTVERGSPDPDRPEDIPPDEQFEAPETPEAGDP